MASAGAREDGTGWGRAGNTRRGEGPAGRERAAEGREEGRRALPNQPGQLGGDRRADDHAGTGHPPSRWLRRGHIQPAALRAGSARPCSAGAHGRDCPAAR